MQSARNPLGNIQSRKLQLVAKMKWKFHEQILGGFFLKTIYGYARVSTPEQSTDRQIKSLEEFGVPTKKSM